jgi:ring-1,2-phenylacetyl-CoA epoxidase subunit PaaE
MQFSKLVIKEVRKETDDCVSIAFDVPASLQAAFNFIHGQNVTVKKIIEGEEIRRSYSICSSPLDGELRIAVKKVSEGKFSSHANEQLQKGHILDVLPPTGNFHTALNPRARKNYIAFAAGSGITPIISIIKTVLAVEPQSRFTLVYGNRNRASIIFKEELENLKNKYLERFSLLYIFSRERTDAPINFGRIDTEKCETLGEKLLDVKNADEIFICGPAEMTFAIKDWLGKQDVADAKIHFELFAGPVTPKIKSSVVQENKEDGPHCKVTIRLDGRSFDFDLPFNGDSILDAALKQGADLPYACKGGVCSTCRAKLTEGKVEMDTNYALEPDELAKGYILTCQSHPRSETLVADFDAK